MHLTYQAPIHFAQMGSHIALNQAVLQGFQREAKGPHTCHSHYELGRYENTAIAKHAIPEIEPVYAAAMQAAREILQQNQLKCGFWFNAMQPGQKTARHNHVESDELLSCVYYISAPNNSGKLILHTADGRQSITPQDGMFVFFPPNLAHEVEENKSAEQRLSLAFNFGPAK
jgi:ectoine hydroxylase-related dioxygenase (phytanoyl-CoA dioxygenase family)